MFSFCFNQNVPALAQSSPNDCSFTLLICRQAACNCNKIRTFVLVRLSPILLSCA